MKYLINITCGTTDIYSAVIDCDAYSIAESEAEHLALENIDIDIIEVCNVCEEKECECVLCDYCGEAEGDCNCEMCDECGWHVDECCCEI